MQPPRIFQSSLYTRKAALKHCLKLLKHWIFNIKYQILSNLGYTLVPFLLKIILIVFDFLQPSGWIIFFKATYIFLRQSFTTSLLLLLTQKYPWVSKQLSGCCFFQCCVYTHEATLLTTWTKYIKSSILTTCDLYLSSLKYHLSPLAA